MRPHRRQPTRLPCPWDSPGKNTGVGCHFLLQCMKVKRESEVAQLSPTLSDPMDCSPPVSSIHEILQARVLAWASISTRPHSKESTSKAGDAGDLSLIPGLRRFPGGGCGNSLQDACLKYPMDRGA